MIGTAGIVLGIALGYWFFESRKPRTGYIENQRVFEAFEGKKYLEEKLSTVKAENKKRIDSLAKSMPASWLDGEITRVNVEEQQLAQQYNADVWREINRLIAEFGQHEGFEYVFGASGTGSLMYASESRDVTDEVIKFVNARYRGDEPD
jgi:outer membrane protein